MPLTHAISGTEKVAAKQSKEAYIHKIADVILLKVQTRQLIQLTIFRDNSVFKIYFKLGTDLRPILAASGPFFRYIYHRQIQYF